MSDPNETGGISVTIKGDEPGGKYNDAKVPGTWIVFHGSPARIREQIIEVFEFEDDAKTRPLFDLVNEATRLFKASAHVTNGLGGKVLSAGPAAASQPAGEAAAQPTGDVWSQVASAQQGAAPAQEEEAADPLLVLIDKAPSVAELQQIWAENQAAFQDAAYMDAYKAKGRALSAK